MSDSDHTTTEKRRPRVGLALGSGGARGWAHLGVIEALEKEGIEISCVAGASMGALVGAVYCSGKLDMLREVALTLDARTVLSYFFEMKFPRSGLIDGDRVLKFLREFIMPADIEALPIPFAAVATDLFSGEGVTIREGDVLDAVRASISIPGIFTPVKRNDGYLVDGGLVNPVPVDVCRRLGAEYVIAVRVNHGPVRGEGVAEMAEALPDEPGAPPGDPQNLGERLSRRLKQMGWNGLPSGQQFFRGEDHPSIFDVLGNSIRIMEAEISTLRLQDHPPDLLMDPELGALGIMEFHRVQEALECGHAIVEQCLPDLLSGAPRALREGDG